jgi:hypothetical protein
MKVVQRRKDGVVQSYNRSPAPFTIVFDTGGKPDEKKVRGVVELKRELRAFYLRNKGDDGYFDVTVYDEKGADVSESAVVRETIDEILAETEEEEQ